MEGKIRIAGRDSRDLSLEERALLTGTVFQNPRAQFFSVDTTGELAFGAEDRRIAAEEIYRRIDAFVARFSIESLTDRNIFQLSGGEKQKIACAAVNVEDPDIILLDEPSSSLDLDAVKHLRDVIHSWKERGKTIVIAEHRLNYLWDLADQMLVMKDGSVFRAFSGEERDALTDRELAEMGLRCKTMEDPSEILLSAITGDSIRLVDFSMRRNRRKLFRFPEMRIAKGKVTALTGRNGRGKTTLLRGLAGWEKRCRGTLADGSPSYRLKEMRIRSFLVMQDVNHQLFTDSVLEEVLISMPEETRRKAMEILCKLHLEQAADRHPMTLSGGEKQRCALACGVASWRRLLLLDEPTSGRDYANVSLLAGQLKRMCAEGRTVVFVSHDSELIHSCCDHCVKLW